jgi:hypothetical protein
MNKKIVTVLSMCFWICVSNPSVTTAANPIERPVEIVISGTIGKDSFQRTFEIAAKVDITNLSVSANDLQGQGSDAWIGSGSIEIQPASFPSLKKDTFASFMLTVKNPTRAGEYRGQIRIRYTDQSPKVDSVPMVVNVKARPRLVLKEPSKIVIKTIRTSTQIPRSFTLHESEGQDSVESVSIIRPDLTTEDQTKTISRDLLAASLATKIPKGGYETGTLILKSLSGVESGKYSGKLTIHPSNADDVEIPVEVSIKDTWFPPSLVLIIGIVVGLLLNWWDTKGKKQTELVDRIRQIQQALVDDNMLNQVFGKRILGLLGSANGKLNRDDRGGAEEDVKKAEQKVDEWGYNGTEYVERIEGIQTTISTKIDQNDKEFQNHGYVLSVREELEGILKQVDDYASLAALDEAIKKCTQRIDKFDDLFKDLKTLAEDLDKFRNQMRPEQAENLKRQIDAVGRHLKSARSEDEVLRVRQEIDAAQKDLDNALQHQLSKGIPRSAQRAAITLPEPPTPKVLPVDFIRKGHSVIKRTIPVLLVLLAASFGLVTIYGGNETFGGAKLYSDYLGLFGWGLGVELTRSKLTEIIKSASK